MQVFLHKTQFVKSIVNTIVHQFMQPYRALEENFTNYRYKGYSVTSKRTYEALAREKN